MHWNGKICDELYQKAVNTALVSVVSFMVMLFAVLLDFEVKNESI